MIKSLQLGVSVGIIWGLSLFICTILAIYTGYSEALLIIIKSIYLGFTISWAGAFIGLLYGFLDGLIGFFLIGWIYNKLCQF